MSTISLETPLAEALSTAVHSKIVEEGWTQEDDTSLAEYIVLMLANGKTQEQIASELAGELLQDAKGTTEFSQWLFQQVNILSGASGATSSEQSAQDVAGQSIPSQSVDSGNSSIPAAYEVDMVDNAPENAPRGPKGLHGGRPAARGSRGAISKPGDSALHRTRGNDRINSHNVRGAPKGPRGGMSRDVRPGMQKALNAMAMAGPPQGMPNPMMMNGSQQGQGMMQMTPQAQMEFMAMMEQQTRMLAQFTGMMPGGNGAFPQGPNQHNGQGRSLFDRVEPGRGRGGSRGRGRGGANQNGHTKSPTKASESDTPMDTDSQAGAVNSDAQHPAEGERKQQSPFNTMCRFNLRCTNAECPYAHQSPAAPEGTVVDTSQVCSFDVACKDATCVAKHHSPGQVKAFQSQEMCKFFPNCTKANCPFKHPAMPVCRFGANCKTPNCPFTHLQIACRFNPCTNMRCPYKHEPGQQKATNFADYTWTADKASSEESKEHVSNRKFVDEQAEEELIKPEESERRSGQGEGIIT